MYDRLNKICKENDISITKLCVELTGSKGNLSTWKKGHMMSDHLIKIANYFNVSVDYLLGRTDNPNSHKFNLQTIANKSENYEEPQKAAFDGSKIKGKKPQIKTYTNISKLTENES